MSDCGDCWRFHEFIAVSCSLDYTMPLGILGSGPFFFRVYHGAGLERVLKRSNCLLLLAPSRAELFLESVLHELDARLSRMPGAVFDSGYGSWFSCLPNRVGESGAYTLYECDRLTPITVAGFRGYHRGYGCLVELLVIYTKARAGVMDPSGEVVGYLLDCMRRTGADDGLVDRVYRLLQSL